MHRKRRGSQQVSRSIVLTDGRVLFEGVSPAFADGFVRAWNRMARDRQPRAISIETKPISRDGPPPADGGCDKKSGQS